MTCPEGETRYQARAYITVANQPMAAWEARCLAPTAEVAALLDAQFLVPEVDGAFADPVVKPGRGCCSG